MSVLIKDLIKLPDRVQPGDFVLRLSEGVTDAAAEATLGSYVITPELAKNFGEALGAIKNALDSRSSKAGYLHGSFGSGKSHFMSVLFLLLRNNPKARSIPEFAEVVAQHDNWLSTKKFLAVPFHMIGAKSMEQGIFGQYLSYVQRTHPGAPLPAVFLAGPVLENAEQLRVAMGDERFFAKLNEGKDDSEWGDLGADWTGESFQRAIAAAPDDDAQRRLVADLVSTLLPAYKDVASSSGYVDLDRGLSALSRHAKALGYDGLVLFLDELILWLASHAADPRFVAEEGQKLVKLVEAQHADRPAPIISFVARQRDLRELVGQQFTGSEDLAFQDVLKHWEGRFFQVKLEDRNLPAIIQKRILIPSSNAAVQQLDRSFNTAAADASLVNALLTHESDLKMFRQVYPFSPALVQTLVAVSSMLQRERTAIKVLLQLLVEQRDTLELGHIVPVGDLFDAVAEGSDAFSESMRQYFDQAKRLYDTKLQPLIERQHGARFVDIEAGTVDAGKALAMRGDDRLVKTLLLAALVPDVEALRSLTPGRLAALNHGTVRTPIPGAEKQQVLGRVRAWAAQVGEVRISDGSDNPTLSVQLAGVDVESILERARHEDNSGNRRRKVRELLFEQLGIDDAGGMFQTHDVQWRGTRRRAEVDYGNVRELADDRFQARGDGWKVLVDFPFDPEPNHSPQDDVARVDSYRKKNVPTRTIVWIPSFLSQPALDDLGALVTLDHILTGERFSGYASHLSPLDQQTARGLLENRRAQLKQRLRMILDGAYGIITPLDGTLAQEVAVGDQMQSLDPACRLRPAVGVNLRDGLDHLLRQALDSQFPKHPDFGPEADIRPAALKRVWTEVQAALQEENWRKRVDQPHRKAVRQVVFPLDLCDVGEDVIVVKRTWLQHFERYHGQEGGALTVKRLRAWMDLPEPRGLLPEVQNLLILAYADMANRRFTLHGGPATATIDSIDDLCELVEEPLPSSSHWETARTRAAAMFGLDAPPLRNASTVGTLAHQVQEAAKAVRPAVLDLARALPGVCARLGVDAASSVRLRTLESLAALLDALAHAGHSDVIAALADAGVPTSPQAMGTAAKRAPAVVAALNATNWQPIEALTGLGGDRKAAADQLLADLRQALTLDELAVSLAGRLQEVERSAVALHIRPVTPPVEPPIPPTAPSPGWKVVDQQKALAVSADAAKDALAAALKRTSSTSDVRVTLSWTIEERTE